MRMQQGTSAFYDTTTRQLWLVLVTHPSSLKQEALTVTNNMCCSSCSFSQNAALQVDTIGDTHT